MSAVTERADRAGVRDRRARLLATVQELASHDRRTATAGERASAAWVASQLSAAGTTDVRTLLFRTQTSWTPAHLAHVAGGIVASSMPGALARLGAAAVATSFELDVSGRNQWVRRVLPAGVGTTVTARVPASADRRRSLVIVAHHDAAQTGWVWHPALVAANRWRSRRTGRAMPSHLPLLVMMAAAALPSRGVRRVARALMTATGLLMIESMRSPTAPGANDNATGVAAALELARRFAAEPLAHTEVMFVFPGGEEVGNTGMRTWMRDAGATLDPATTLVVNLDALGSGEHLVVSSREGLTAFYHEQDTQLALRLASEANVDLRRVTFPNVSDAYIARHAGLRVISLLSYADGWISNLHRSSDIPDNVHWNTVEDAITLTSALAGAWDVGDA